MRKDRNRPSTEGATPRSRVRGGLTRRQFLTTSASVGLLAGLPAGALGTGLRHRSKKHPHTGKRPTERRTYVFDLSHIDTSMHDLILVAGATRAPLHPVTGLHRALLRRYHPILRAVPDDHLTHIITLDMPSDAVQLCYVQRIDRSATDDNCPCSTGDAPGYWDMAYVFYHLPTSSLRHAQRRRRRLAAEAAARQHRSSRRGHDQGPKSAHWDRQAPVPVKWARYGITPDLRAALSDPVGEDTLKDSMDQAVALVAGYPELSSGDPDSAAHIQTNIIAPQPQTQQLGEIIEAQGSNWSTQTPLINPATGQPYCNSSNQCQYMPLWSQQTSQFAGQAIAPALTTAKNDTTLGVNITDIDPVTVSSDFGAEPVTGAIWTLHDGNPTVDQSDSAPAPGDTAFSFQVTSQSPSNGYYVGVQSVDANRNVTIQIKNWYVRYLGLYIRYLDGNDQPIELSGDFADDLSNSGYFEYWDLGFNGQYDAYVNVISPEWVILGMPVETTTIDFTFPMPSQAVSAQILCGGLGSGANPYPGTLNPGVAMTVVFDISLPALFLALAAAPGFPRLSQQLQDANTLLWVMNLVVEFFIDLVAATDYDDPAAFAGLGPEIGEKLLDQGAEQLDQLIASSIAEGESVEAVEDAVPVIGLFLAAISAIGLVAQLTETSAEVAQSPKTYATKITFTHDIDMTIKPDPMNTVFPAEATYYVLTATFDSGTPYTLTRQLPGTVPVPISDTFTAVPFGGQVTVSIGFYSASGWLAGQGSVGPTANTSSGGPLALEITITQNQVPLRLDTVYSHKELIVLDASGGHQWQETTAPPPVTTPGGQCESVDGQLCQWTGITISTPNGDVGYAWQAYNSAVGNCATGAVTQLHQFANISLGADPESAYFYSGCGFSGTARIVYDLIGKKDWNFYLDPTDNQNLIRQIRLSGAVPDFDGPNSNLAWGRFRFSSNAMLLHPAGRVISINESLNKIEVIELPAAAVPDADAPLSQAYSGTGIREGLLDGPTLAALDPDGTILILETRNNRIQAFDLGANPVPKFSQGAYFVNLMDTPTAYLDLAVEYTGYLYVLSYTGQPGSLLYRLDIYTPDGVFLSRTAGFNAARLAVNYWRDIFALNYQVLMLPDGTLPERTEPSVSHWIPSTP